MVDVKTCLDNAQEKMDMAVTVSYTHLLKSIHVRWSKSIFRSR